MSGFRKKLIEVAMPLETINREAAREKSIRHGHPSTLHLWWARRPLAACRAVLFGQLVDDPGSVPEEFPTEAEQEKERDRLHRLIERLVPWEATRDEGVLGEARREIARSIARWRADRGEAEGIDAKMRFENPSPAEVSRYLAEKAPPVHDPFAGGGSIPLEAQRLGLRAIATDLNPVAVLINKALIEIPPRFAGMEPVNPEWQSKSAAERNLKTWRGAEGLAEDMRHYGRWMRDEAEKRIGHLYPKVKVTAEMAEGREDLEKYVGRELTVIAWLWARTVTCPNPVCGATMPLVASYWLSKKKHRKVWVEPQPEGRRVRFRVATGDGMPPDPPKLERATAFRCVCCGQNADLAFVKAEGTAGRMGQKLMGIVLEGNGERVYVKPFPGHEQIAAQAKPTWQPEQALPHNPRDYKVPLYGMKTFANLFTPRQLVAMTTFSDLVTEARKRAETDGRVAGLANDGEALEDGGAGANGYGEALATYLGLAVSRYTNACTTICSWNPGEKKEDIRQTFSRQAIPMVWDFAEGNPFSGSSGNFADNTQLWFYKGVSCLPATSVSQSKQENVDADHNLEADRVTSTDPPYYDNIGYADLSDFFYVWLRRSLRDVFPSLFGTMLTPKDPELIATPYRERTNGKTPEEFFEDGLRAAFAAIRRRQVDAQPVTVFYAFKQAESDNQDTSTASTGWDTMLSGLLKSGLSIEATWPVRTERGGRTIGIGTNALASSIVLVCRPRLDDAPLGTRNELIAALKRELPEAVKRLQAASIAPVDLAQSAIGPGMAIFSRYAKVLEPDGSAMTVRKALGLINQVLDEVLAAEEAEYDADTRWAITWFTQYGFSEASFGEAEVLATARNTSISGLERAGILAARSGKVRLLKRDEMEESWDPVTDDRFTVWEACQHLIRALEHDGEQAAARLLNRLGSAAEPARELAYRLYQHCERKKDADEARAYNGLVVAWPRLAAQALPGPADGGATATFDFEGDSP